MLKCNNEEIAITSSYKQIAERRRISLSIVYSNDTKNRTAHTARGALTARITKHRTAHSEPKHCTARTDTSHRVVERGVQ